jgi:hypothetical protein
MLSKSVQTSSFFNIIEGIWLFFESLNAISRTNFTILNYYIDPCGLGFQIVYLVSIFFSLLTAYMKLQIFIIKRKQKKMQRKKKEKRGIWCGFCPAFLVSNGLYCLMQIIQFVFNT